MTAAEISSLLDRCRRSKGSVHIPVEWVLWLLKRAGIEFQRDLRTKRTNLIS